MNRYVRRFICAGAFFLGISLLLVLVSFLFVPKDNTEEAGMEEVFANGILGEKADTIDVLVLGDSYSYTSTVPPEIWKSDGYTVYTSGTNDQPLDYTLEMLRRVFRTQHPKLVVLEASPIYRELTRFEQLLADLETVFSVFRYHDRWKSLRKEDLFRLPEYTLTKDYKGYRYYTKIDPAPDPGVSNMIPTSEATPVPRSCVRYLRKIKDCCESHGARLILFSAPNRMYWDYPHHNGIVELAGEIGCEYTDMNLENDRIGIDWSHDTCDKGDHLNHAGAVKATRFLTGYLASCSDLEDHRGDPAYSEWDRCLKKYEKQVRKEDI